jgi:hypothetical protein
MSQGFSHGFIFITNKLCLGRIKNEITGRAEITRARASLNFLLYLYWTETTTSVEIWVEPEFPRTEMV